MRSLPNLILSVSLVCFAQLASADSISIEKRDQVLKTLKTNLYGVGDHVERKVERLGDKTLRLETLISLEADLPRMISIFKDVKSYPDWIIRDINVNAEGDPYRMQVLSFKPNGIENQLVLDMNINVPIIRRKITRVAEFSPMDIDGTFVLKAEMHPTPEGMVESGLAHMYLVQATDDNSRVWVYIDGSLKLRNWLIYQALPKRLLQREAGERVDIVLRNYMAEELSRSKPAETVFRENTVGKLSSTDK